MNLFKDNQNISYCEYGEKTGIPIFYFHGFPGSHLEVLFFNGDEVARKLKLRIIAINRPGYGNSQFKSMQSLLDWPSMVIDLADDLGIAKFSILGYSGGAPYALACTYKITNRLNKVSIVSGMVPYDCPEAKKGGAMFIPKLPIWLQIILLKKMGNLVLKSPEKIKKSITKNLATVDKQSLKRPEVMSVFLELFREAFKQSHMGALQDAQLYSSVWGFDLSDVKHPIDLWHGEKDLNVRIASAQYLSNQLPNCISRFYTEEGHISLICNHAEEILKCLGTKIQI